jgi:hypothetical protein
MRDGVGYVSGASLAFGPNHRSALGDPPERLSEIGRAADERHGEQPLVDVVGVVRRGENFRLVHIVDTKCLQHLRFDEMADARLGHDRDGDGGDDAVDHVRITHPGYAALRADVGWNPFERHDRDRTSILGDLGLLRSDDVHDHAALEHLRHPTLDPLGSDNVGVGGGRLGVILL